MCTGDPPSPPLGAPSPPDPLNVGTERPFAPCIFATSILISSSMATGGIPPFGSLPCEPFDVSGYLTPGLVKWRKFTDAPLLILAVGSLPLLLLELARNDLTRGDKFFLDVVNIVVLVAFAVDYVAELRLARPKGRFVRGEWTSLLIGLFAIERGGALPG